VRSLSKPSSSILPFARSAKILATAALLALTAAPPMRAQDPAVVGEWGPLIEGFPVPAVHSILLHTGKILFFRGDGEDQGGVGVYRTHLFDPDTSQFQTMDPGANVFCAAHSFLPDGRVLVTGGEKEENLGPVHVHIFDPVTETWTRVDDMRDGRYYPTNVAHGDGSTYIFAGRDPSGGTNPEVERYVPNGGPSGEDVIEYIAGADNSMVWYPRMHLLSTGKIVRVGEEDETEVFDPATGQWNTEAYGNYGTREWGTSVALPPSLDRIMILGGYDSGTYATNTTEIIDLSDPSPSWSYAAPMHYRRMHVNVITLPDGKVFVAGGTEDDAQNISAFYSEMYDPQADSWTLMAPQDSARIYHSSSVLLPDARVMWLGAYADTGGNKDPTAQIFSPPYLFAGPRPTITSAPGSADYSTSFDIETPDAAQIAKVVLIHPSATTHSTNMAQRYIELSFSQVDADTLQATVPSNVNAAPPGYYLLFLVDDDGIPSEAPFIRIGGPLPPRTEAGDDQTIILPAPALLDGTVTSGAGLVTTWTAENPPGPVVFGDANAVDTTATFTVPGDYVLRLTAVDGALIASDTMTVTALPVGTIQPIEIRISSGDDDAEELADGSISLGSTDLDMHDYGAPGNHLAVGLRFPDLQLPIGAQITDAGIEFESDQTDDLPTTLVLTADAAPNAAPFIQTTGNLTSRTTTGASVTWVVPPWQNGTTGPETRSPPLTTVVQEVVSQAGWLPGNSLAILITDGGTGSQRVAESYDGGPTAAALFHVEYTTEPVCDDGEDNDGDGLTDFPNDPGCDDILDASEQSPLLVCDDGIDNEGDGLTDHPEDPDCGGDPTGSSEGVPVTDCDDGQDNDGDGFIDTIDPGCDSASDPSENSPALVCDNGDDDDGDGVADFPADPGCSTLLDTSEKNAALVCDDDIDNDGDGLTDFPADPGCVGLLDSSEREPGVICDDEVDNDGDGLTDFPADPGCIDPGDGSEVDVTTIVASIAVGPDDAEEKADGSITLTSSDLEIHEYDAGAPHLAVGLRFTDLLIPPGASIVSAYVQFEAAETDTPPATFTVDAEYTGHAPPFSLTNSDLTSRTTTAATVSWLVPEWQAGDAGPAQRTDDLATLIQEVVSHPDWAEGNAIAFLITKDPRPSGSRVAESFDGGGQAAQLHVEVAIQATACNDGVDNDGDGRTDFPDDPGCASVDDDSERDATLVCDDGIDNDGDTLTDVPDDPGCATPSDTSEQNASVACDDGIDQDGDGANDFPTDPGCTSADDLSEREPGLVCDDGVDNDGDGLFDYPDDPGCGEPAAVAEAPNPTCADPSVVQVVWTDQASFETELGAGAVVFTTASLPEVQANGAAGYSNGHDFGDFTWDSMSLPSDVDLGGGLNGTLYADATGGAPGGDGGGGVYQDDDYRLTFDPPVEAAGIEVFENQLEYGETITFYDDQSPPQVIASYTLPGGSGQEGGRFMGIRLCTLDGPLIGSIEVEEGDEATPLDDDTGFDNVVYLPEPGASWMLAAGAGLLALMRRRLAVNDADDSR
jgi:hypothetical protein